jgi:putative transposase
VLIEAWRKHFNTVRPHSSLGYLTPAAFAAKIEKQGARTPKRRGGSLRYLGPPRPAPSHSRPARGK